MKYDLIHIQSIIKKYFSIVIPNQLLKDSHVNIPKHKMYKKHITKVVQEVINLYTPDDETYIVDYNSNCFYSLMCSMQDFNVIYINPLQKYNKFIELSKIINDIDFVHINSRFKINNHVKTKFIPLLIVNDPADLSNSKRPLNGSKLHNIIIIRDYIEGDYEHYIPIIQKNYIFFKIHTLLTKIDNLKEFLETDAYSSVIAVAPNSKYSTLETVYFD